MRCSRVQVSFVCKSQLRASLFRENGLQYMVGAVLEASVVALFKVTVTDSAHGTLWPPAERFSSNSRPGLRSSRQSPETRECMASLEECNGIGVASLQSALMTAMRFTDEPPLVFQLEQCHKLTERAEKRISALDEKRTEQSLELGRGLRRLERLRQQVAILQTCSEAGINLCAAAAKRRACGPGEVDPPSTELELNECVSMRHVAVRDALELGDRDSVSMLA